MNETKTCTVCKTEKMLGEFYERKTFSKEHKKGPIECCKSCCSKIRKIWWKNNHKKAMKKMKGWQKNNPQKYFESKEKYNKKHKKERVAYYKKWCENNPERVRFLKKRWSKKVSLSVSYRLSHRMSDGIRDAICKNKAGRHWETLVDFTLEELKKHIESQFKDGMTWGAFMQGNIHIDHKIPQSKFKYEKPEDTEFRVCWSLSNLQPLWAKDNLSKSSKTMDEWKKTA